MEATSRSSNPSGDGIVDPTPLLAPIQEEDRGRRFSRRPGLRGAARFLRRASGRRVMREQSMRVRETAAEQLEERQSDWAYSRPVVVLDIIWNLAFVIVAFTVLVLSRRETALIPLRLWIVGYAMQCVLHMICVCIEFRRRQVTQGLSFLEEQDGSSNGGNLGAGTLQESYQGGGYGAELAQGEERTSVAKHLESANTMFSFIWWIIGFYWVSAGGQNLAGSAPQLYWLCIVFLAFDVFFVVFCVAVACVVGIAVCCCLPCIIAILYAVADQEGATEEDICQLPKYKFQRYGDIEKLNGEISGPSGGIMSECGTETPIEHVLSMEEAECCICISAYDDEVELRELPCSHHFHSTCIDKWLFINATCPLCKFNILKGSIHGREDV